MEDKLLEASEGMRTLTKERRKWKSGGLRTLFVSVWTEKRCPEPKRPEGQLDFLEVENKNAHERFKVASESHSIKSSDADLPCLSATDYNFHYHDLTFSTPCRHFVGELR